MRISGHIVANYCELVELAEQLVYLPYLPMYLFIYCCYNFKCSAVK